jgi:NADH pyrophosphatase-like rudimentary NUDIX domain
VPAAAAAHAPRQHRSCSRCGLRCACANICQDWTHVAVIRSSRGPIPAAGWRQLDLRKLMSELPAADLALAGHAVALAAWHEVHTAANPDLLRPAPSPASFRAMLGHYQCLLLAS